MKIEQLDALLVLKEKRDDLLKSLREMKRFGKKDDISYISFSSRNRLASSESRVSIYEGDFADITAQLSELAISLMTRELEKVEKDIEAI